MLLGHIGQAIDAGDRVISEVGRRLQQAVRAVDTVARLGGDEFVVLLADLPQARIAAAMAQQILAVLFEPMLIHGHELAPASSIPVLQSRNECQHTASANVGKRSASCG